MRQIYFLGILSLMVALPNILSSQCGTWVGIERQEDAINAHSVYRQDLKSENFDAAFNSWKIAYELAPAADGKRDFHFMDGIKIYKHKLKNTEDEELKKEYHKIILDLYEACVNCYQEGTIKIRNCNDQECLNTRIGTIKGREAYDMYYLLGSDQASTYKVMAESIDLAGVNSEYIVVAPFAALAVNQYIAGKITDAQARDAHKKLNEITEYNVANNERYAQYYEQVQANVINSFARIESEIYDCDYFKKKLLPDYEADPENGEVIKYTYNKLKNQGCDTSDPLLIELKQRYLEYAKEMNAELQAELEKNNPAIAGKRLYDEGKYNEAIQKYIEAIEKDEDDQDKAEHYFIMASIQGRKLKDFTTARKNALTAAKLKPNWGRPYMLIGDMYAMSSRNCGDSWNQRLAVLAALDKYAYAKSVDPEVASEANEKIARYNGSKPDQETAFMMGFNEGSVVQVGCWIGEKVKLRF